MNKIKKGKMFIGIIVAVALVCFFRMISTGDSVDEYEVISLPEDGQIEQDCTLYINTVASEYVNVSETVMFYYFRTEIDKAKKQDIFLEPVFQNGELVMERYRHVNSDKKGFTFSKDGLISKKVFSLAKETSIEKPLMLLTYNGDLYGVIGSKAYVLYLGYQYEVPKMLPQIHFGEKELVTYAISSDGSFDIID